MICQEQAPKKLLSVYINATLIERLEKQAKSQHRTKSGQIEYYLEQNLPKET
jgi:hypothetical protein